jgi:ABC-2 type transport system ATP-binding protein
MVVVEHLRKTFGSLTAVNDVSFQISPGETFGLLGPNGAGKTTTISMLTGVLAPDSGRVSLEGGQNPRQPSSRRRLGVAPQSVSLYDELTADENLKFFGTLYGLRGGELKQRVAWALEFAGLTERRGSRVGTFSGGMKRRLNLACGLLHQPRFVLLDEPTAGVDPQSRNHLFQSIDRLKENGCTLLYTTHYMEEAQRLCDRIAIMDHGRILALDTPEGLIRQHGGHAVVEVELESLPEPLDVLPAKPDGLHVRWDTRQPLEDVGRLSSQGVRFTSLLVRRPDLESVFLTLTGRSLRD